MLNLRIVAEGYRRFSSTRVWQKWRLSAPQTHLWLIKVWFSASTFVVKIATFAKPETVMPNAMTTTKTEIVKSLGDCPWGHFQRAFGLTNFWLLKTYCVGQSRTDF